MHAGVIVLCMTNAAPERVCTLTSQCDPHRSQISTESVTFDDSQYHLTHRGCRWIWQVCDCSYHRSRVRWSWLGSLYCFARTDVAKQNFFSTIALDLPPPVQSPSSGR